VLGYLFLVAFNRGLLRPTVVDQQRLPSRGPRFRPPRLGPWPYTVSVANSFRCSFVWVLWPEYQVWSAVVATPLAYSTPSDHDGPNATATALSVYVIVRPAAAENAACTMALGLGCGRYFQMMWRDSNTGPEVNQGLCLN
jgi:hypothetical protein